MKIRINQKGVSLCLMALPAHIQSKKDMKRTPLNWSDNSKHFFWVIGKKKLKIFISLNELFLFVAYSTMILIFCWSDHDFSFQLSGRSVSCLLKLIGSVTTTRQFPQPFQKPPHLQFIATALRLINLFPALPRASFQVKCDLHMPIRRTHSV